MADKTEWVVTYRNADGIEFKIAYRNAGQMAQALIDQTRQGWAAVSVVERPVETYAK
jgi:hypothetical protein